MHTEVLGQHLALEIDLLKSILKMHQTLVKVTYIIKGHPGGGREGREREGGREGWWSDEGMKVVGDKRCSLAKWKWTEALEDREVYLDGGAMKVVDDKRCSLAKVEVDGGFGR